jgi:predicted PurR-regulated permease PerM
MSAPPEATPPTAEAPPPTSLSADSAPPASTSPTADAAPPPPVGPVAHPSPWSQTTRDRWFFAALASAFVAMLVLLSPYLNVMLFSVVTVVVTWPVYQRILRFVGGRRPLAAVLCMVGLAALMLGPVGIFAGLFVQQSVVVVASGVSFVKSGQLTEWIDWLAQLPEAQAASVPPWLMEFVPEDFSIRSTVAGPIQDGALATLNAVGSAVPALFESTVTAGVDLMIFLFAVPSLYMDGPAALRVIQNLSPIDDDYEEKLFSVFAELCNNMVLGAFGTALAMGVSAGVGYAIAGVDRVFFYAVLTAVMSFIPFVGTAVVWIPLTVLVGVNDGWGWGAFLAIWSLVVTSNVDTLIRPLFMRGSTNVHPLLVFLSAFGGLSWMGLPGALVGPVIVAFFVALYSIYAQDYLGIAPEAE